MKTVSLRAKIGLATLNIALLSSTIMTTPGMAQDVLPTGGKVVAGSATISTDRGSMTIDQSTDKLVTNWDSFSIGENNSVTFNQPTAQSVALNRVIGQDPSRILGRLTANGNVFLLNPNGIVISKDGSVQSGGFVGSTLGMSDKDFLDGKYQFAGSGGAIVNQGDLKGGVVALIAPRIQNAGTITGDAALAAGTDITLDFDGDGLISVEVSASTLGTLVENSGLIKADGGLAILTAKGANDAMRGVVNNSGTIEAAALENRNGRILLLGDMKHGEVNADGTLSASFVETSAARVNIADDLQVKTNGGTWLIDPNDFTIAASGGNMTGATLSNNLANGNVTITTASQGTAGGNGDIFVNDGVTWSANRLTLNADRNININTAMNASGTAGLALEYAQTNNAGDYYVNAPVNLASTGSFSTKEGRAAAISYTIITSLGASGSTTATDLQGIEGNLSGNYVLGSNIDASSTGSWNAGAGFRPIGDGAAANVFTGNFDGLGHSVSGLTISRPTAEAVGLFGLTGTGAKISNIGITNANILGYRNVGALVGSHSDSQIEHSYSSGIVSGYNNVGGLVGRATFVALIFDSYSSATVRGDVQIGGLVGNCSELCEIYRSHATGNVTGTSSDPLLGSRVGGLVGFFGRGLISNSYASGDVDGYSYVGGFIGSAFNSRFLSTVENSYSTGSVSGTEHVGGFVGELGSGPRISNSYATGRVQATVGGAGGFVGRLESSSSLENVFFDQQATGQTSGCGSIVFVSATCNATGLTTAEMKNSTSFTGASWDFNTIWAIDPAINNGYPYLRANAPAAVVTPPPPPPPPPPAPVLAINDFGASFSTTVAPYQPPIALTGSNFDAVTEIRFSYTGPNGQAGTIIWNAANQFGGGRFVVGAGGTSATISPVLVAAGDPAGSYQWTVTFVAGSQSIARNFTVAYSSVVVPPPPPPPPPAALTLGGGIGSDYSTAVAPYQPIFDLIGGGLLGLSEIRLSYTGPAGQTGTVILNTNNGFNGRLTNVTNSSATFSPVLIADGDPPGLYRWTVTFSNGVQSATSVFSVNYTGAQLKPPVPIVVPSNPPSGLVLGASDSWLDDQHLKELDTSLAKLNLLANDTPPELALRLPEMVENAVKYWVYAAMSHNVYEDDDITLPAGWREDQAAGSAMNGLNGFYAETWVYEVDGQVRDVVMVFRGSERTGNDWGNNFFPALTAPQQELAEIYGRMVRDWYPNANIVATGHSLGGALAKAAVSGTNDKAIVFNSSPRGPESQNVIYIEEVGDPLDFVRPDRETDIRFSFTNEDGNQHSMYNLANGMRQLAE